MPNTTKLTQRTFDHDDKADQDTARLPECTEADRETVGKVGGSGFYLFNLALSNPIH